MALVLLLFGREMVARSVSGALLSPKSTHAETYENNMKLKYTIHKKNHFNIRMQHYDSSMCLHTFGNHLLMTQTLCKNITGGNTIEPKHISDSQNDSMPYALYLYIIPQCSRSLPQTYSVSSHAKKTFPPHPSFPQFDTFSCGIWLPWLPVFPFKMPCQLQRTQVYGSVINSTNKRAYWDHRTRCGLLLSPRL